MGHIHRLRILIHQGIDKIPHQVLCEAGAVYQDSGLGHLVHFIFRTGDMDRFRAEHRFLLVQDQALLLLSLKHQLHRHILFCKLHRLHGDAGGNSLVQAHIGDTRGIRNLILQLVFSRLRHCLQVRRHDDIGGGQPV